MKDKWVMCLKHLAQFQIKGDVIIFIMVTISFSPGSLVAEASSTLGSVSNALLSSVSLKCHLPSH